MDNGGIWPGDESYFQNLRETALQDTIEQLTKELADKDRQLAEALAEIERLKLLLHGKDELEDDLLKCYNSVENNQQQKKIIKLNGYCYDGTGWNECPFWNRHPENHRCMLFGKDGIPKNASHSLIICNRIYGETYEGDV